MPPCPDSFKIKLPKPLFVLLAIPIVISMMLGLYILVDSFAELLLIVVLWLLIASINIRLHEKMHKYVIGLLTGVKCKINFINITPNCSFDEPIDISAYRIGCLAPLVPLFMIFLFTIIALLTPYSWLKIAFVFATVSGLFGLGGDIYYFIVTCKYQKDYLIIDHGKEITLIKKLISI